MDTLLFSSRSIWTMAHGIFLGGGGLVAVAAALFAMIAMRSSPPALQLHARSEEEIFYPAALLVGDLVRARSR